MERRPIATTPYQQLRWKLALSYAGVTVLALLTVELLLIAIVGASLTTLLSSGAIPNQMIDEISTRYAPFLRPHLSESPPNLAGIDDVLAFADSATATTLPLSFDIREYLVIDPDRVVLGASPADLLGEDSIGHPLDSEILPELSEPLHAALAGEEDPDHLFAIGGPGGRAVFVVPVWDAERLSVLGAFVGLAEIPTTASFLGEAAPVVGVSLLFFTGVSGVAGIAYGLLAARGPVARLGRMSTAAEAWARGDFSVVVEDPSTDELGQLARRLNDMTAQLQQLFEMRQELAVLRERNRLAQDLHDSAKQLAFAAAAQIGSARTLVARDPSEAAGHIEEAERLIRDLRQELSSLIFELAPPALEEKGLPSAIREYSESWSRRAEIEVRLDVEGARPLPPHINETVFRIAQEALANAARHSGAHQARIELIYEGDSIRCIVQDDGVGFDLEETPKGFGLHSMADRAHMLGGQLVIESEPGAGTRVMATLPIDNSDHDLEGEEHG